MRRTTQASRRITWSPGWRLRVVLLAMTVGSVGGLVFGLSSLNRPILNAAVFYLLGAAAAAAVAVLTIVTVPLVRHQSRADRLVTARSSRDNSMAQHAARSRGRRPPLGG